jgi:hypothetical protein
LRTLIAALVVVGAALAIPTPSQAAPVPLTGTASHTFADDADLAVVEVAKRSRRTVRHSARKCGWQCKRYYHRYQYRYWKFYYPYGGPLFYSRR